MAERKRKNSPAVNLPDFLWYKDSHRSTEITNMKPILEIRDLSKYFPGVKALDHMNFDLFPGEVHILAGENGAGKSTLCKCILGYLQPDEGQIFLDGEEVSFASTRQALSRGIGAVYQEFTLIPWLSAAENIYFNREPVIPGTGIIRSRKMNRDAAGILREIGSGDMDVTQPVGRLGIAGQQIVEIAKMLSAGPRIMIFDEPTAALSEREVDALFKKICQLKEKGIGIIYISHRLQEYSRIGDRITVMRDGCFISTNKIDDLSEEKLIYQMVGREAGSIYVRREQARESEGLGEEVLRVEGLRDRKGKVRDGSLFVMKGEIVGLAGLVGSGRTELAELLAGINRPSAGRLILHGKDVTGKGSREMVQEGIGLLPEDRKVQGLAPRASVMWNITAASLARLFPSRMVRQEKEKKTAREYISKLDIAVPGPETAAASLSGGNQQKVVMAKWLLANTDFVIFDEPTRGIDVGAKMEIYRLMDDMTSKGKSILMISSELPEILGMSDRIYVMREGRIVAQVQKGQADEESLGKLMMADDPGAGTGTGSEEKEAVSEPSAALRERRKALAAGQLEWKRRGKRIVQTIPPGFYMMLSMMLFFGFLVDHYYSMDNLGMIFRQAAPLLVIACGQTVIILTQGTDLSLGSIVSLTCVLWIALLNLGTPMAGAVAVTLLAALLCGVFNGILAAKAKIPVFITTLGTQNIFKSAALLLCGSMTIYFNDSIFRRIAKEGVLGLSWSVWIGLAVFAATWFILNETTFGKKVKGLGGNPEAVILSGASKDKSMMGAFALAGILAGIGGLLICCRIESGNPNAGNGLEFSAVAAVLLGGTSLREGRGGVGGTVFGVLMIQILKSGLMQMGVSSIYQNAIIGIVVLGAIIIDALFRYYEQDRLYDAGRGGGRSV